MIEQVCARNPVGRLTVGTGVTPHASAVGSFLPNFLADSHQGCKDPRPYAWSMCAACFCPWISLSRATPSGRSHHQTSELPTELPTYKGADAACGRRKRHAQPRAYRATSLIRNLPPLRTPIARSLTSPFLALSQNRDWHSIAEQPAPAPHLARS